MSHILFQVDAFTKTPFSGNPAGVCMLTEPVPDDWMQALAAEMNLSETAFLLPDEEGWRLRWFTPATEIDLCGHATLASAKILFETRPELRPGPISFWTRSGQMQARWVNDQVELDFPAFRPEPLMIELEIAGMLGFQPVEAVSSGNFFLFEAADEETIRTAKPDFAALAASTMPEVMITAKGKGGDYDFVSRFFAPQLGIDEDPVTGSAHCLLAPYWAEKLGQTTFTAYQASARGGWLNLRLEGDRLRIAGDSVIIFSAEVLV
jgi:PhzF family phenazine biosynthesis protein